MIFDQAFYLQVTYCYDDHDSPQLTVIFLLYIRYRKQFDTNPRYRYDNIASLELDMPDKTTQVREAESVALSFLRYLTCLYHI